MIAAALIHLGFVPMVDFVVQDDGEGPYLRAWLSAEPQPGEQAIADAIAALEAEPPRYVPVATARERLEAAGKLADVAAVIDQNGGTALLLRLLSLREGLSPEDPQVIFLLEAAGADPDAILAP